MAPSLKKIYKKFLNYKKKHFLKDAFFQFGVEELKIEKKKLNLFFENYYRVPFFEFLCDLKFIIFSKNVYEFILKKATDNWELWYYLNFLKKERIIRVSLSGRPKLIDKKFLTFLPKPKSQAEIEKIIEKKLKLKIKPQEPINLLFKRKFIKENFDQLPISQESAIFLAEKILERLPLFETFLFVGDDDLISLILSLVEPKISSFVFDLDDSLLRFISSFSKKFGLKIETRKGNILKKEKIKKSFVGFLANPAYTEEGVKKFLDFGTFQLNKDGGVIFLVFGDEAIGNRIIFLEKFFAQKGFINREIILKKIYYPNIIVHKEDKIISKRLEKLTRNKKTEKQVRLGASLFIFDYLPFKIKKIKFSKPVTAYL